MATLPRPSQRNDQLHPPRTTDRTKVVASNECVLFARLASVPPTQFALAPNAHAQQMHVLRVNSEAQCAGVQDGTRRASPALLLSSAIDEHWGVAPNRLAFVLNIATAFPMEAANSIIRRTDRIASLEYAVLHTRARLANAHVALDELAVAADLSHQRAHPESELAQLPPIEQGIELADASAFLPGKSRAFRDVLVGTQRPTDPTLHRAFHPRPEGRLSGNDCAFAALEGKLADLGLLDLRPDGVIDRVIHRSLSALALDICVNGVGILHAQFPSGAVAIGEWVYVALVADAWDIEALAAHEAVEEVVAVREWLARDPSNGQYNDEERAAYMQQRDRLLDRDDWEPSEASQTRCTLANFQMRLMSSVDMRNATATARERGDAEGGTRRKRRRPLGEEEAAKEQEARLRTASAWLDDPKTAPFIPKRGLQRSRCVTERVAFAWNLGRVLSMDPLNGSYTLNVGVYPITSEQLHRRYSKRGE